MIDRLLSYGYGLADGILIASPVLGSIVIMTESKQVAVAFPGDPKHSELDWLALLAAIVFSVCSISTVGFFGTLIDHHREHNATPMSKSTTSIIAMFFAFLSILAIVIIKFESRYKVVTT